MYVDNRHFYGYLPVPLKPHQTLEEEKETFIHLLMEIMSELKLYFRITIIQLRFCNIVEVNFVVKYILVMVRLFQKLHVQHKHTSLICTALTFKTNAIFFLTVIETPKKIYERILQFISLNGIEQVLSTKPS